MDSVGESDMNKRHNSSGSDMGDDGSGSGSIMDGIEEINSSSQQSLRSSFFTNTSPQSFIDDISIAIEHYLTQSHQKLQTELAAKSPNLKQQIINAEQQALQLLPGQLDRLEMWLVRNLFTPSTDIIIPSTHHSNHSNHSIVPPNQDLDEEQKLLAERIHKAVIRKRQLAVQNALAEAELARCKSIKQLLPTLSHTDHHLSSRVEDVSSTAKMAFDDYKSLTPHLPTVKPVEQSLPHFGAFHSVGGEFGNRDRVPTAALLSFGSSLSQ